MLPTGDPLGTVVTMLATPFGRLDGLAIDTAGAGGWRPTGSPPDSPSEGVIDGLPGSVSFPRRKVVVDGPPWGKIVGQRSPDTAIAVAVEDGINHGSHLGLAWPPTGAGRRQEGLQDSPLLACQITGVWLRVHTLSTFETPLLEQTLSAFTLSVRSRGTCWICGLRSIACRCTRPPWTWPRPSRFPGTEKEPVKGTSSPRTATAKTSAPAAATATDGAK